MRNGHERPVTHQPNALTIEGSGDALCSKRRGARRGAEREGAAVRFFVTSLARSRAKGRGGSPDADATRCTS